jgi:membrane protein implicated in regulation of membrane protease activity
MSWFVGVLTVRTVVAGLTFFGLAGLAANASGAHPAGSLAVAGAAGITALYVVAWIMKSLYRLRADGTVRIHNALGQTGAVYLTIPARKTGRGKVTVTLQNRTMEYEAETDQSEIPTGATVRVVAVVDSETLAVETVPEPARPHHV